MFQQLYEDYIKPNAFYIIVLIFMFLFITYCWTNTKEPFTSSSSKLFPKQISKNNVDTLDNLNIEKYRDNYNNMHDELILWCDNQILNAISSNKINTNKGLDKSNLDTISNLNNLKKFKDTLEVSSNYLSTL